MAAQRVRAFTLVELLIVIAIIGTLVGLLLPAFQHARESSRRSTCVNNLRQIALGTLHYEDRLKRFPGLFEPLDSARLISQSGVTTTTWAVILLAELERQQVYDANATGELPNVFIPFYVCPSDALKSHVGSEGSYVANGGRLGPSSIQKPSNGPFVNRAYSPTMATLEGHWVDGRDYTLAYSENINATYYDEVGWNIYLAADVTYDSNIIGKERTFNPVFLWGSTEEEQVRINGDGADQAEVNKCERVGSRRYNSHSCPKDPGWAAATRARPSSYHTNGVNMAFGGGRVVFVRDNIDYRVYIALMTMNDRQSDSPNPKFLLQDSQYQ